MVTVGAGRLAGTRSLDGSGPTTALMLVHLSGDTGVCLRLLASRRATHRPVRAGRAGATDNLVPFPRGALLGRGGGKISEPGERGPVPVRGAEPDRGTLRPLEGQVRRGLPGESDA